MEVPSVYEIVENDRKAMTELPGPGGIDLGRLQGRGGEAELLNGKEM